MKYVIAFSFIGVFSTEPKTWEYVPDEPYVNLEQCEADRKTKHAQARERAQLGTGFPFSLESECVKR